MTDKKYETSSRRGYEKVFEILAGRGKKEGEEERNQGERGNDIVGYGLSNEARPSFASFAMPTH